VADGAVRGEDACIPAARDGSSPLTVNQVTHLVRKTCDPRLARRTPGSLVAGNWHPEQVILQLEEYCG
jgi:hypothetical protein